MINLFSNNSLLFTYNQFGGFCMEKNFRTWGAPPYHTITIHGGPGAAGELARFSKILSQDFSCVELLQTKFSVDDEIQEIYDMITKYADDLVVLIGHSWGALISLLFSARNLEAVKKLILVGCPPLVERYVQNVQDTRWDRISMDQLPKIKDIEFRMDDSDPQIQNQAFFEFGKFYETIDSFSLDPTLQIEDPSILRYSYEIANKIWLNFIPIRRSGQLLEEISKIKSELVFIHGEFDPHPIEGIEKPLQSINKPYTLHILKECGHSPWVEHYAYQQFYEILKKELNSIK